jgi:NADH-quinone oxidoreductase subunit E
MSAVAAKLSIHSSEVYSIASFYNQFRLTPPGRHQIKVCLGTACQTKGGRIILDSWKRELHLEEGQTSADREYSLERVACVGCCAMAPVTVVDGKIESKVSPTRIKGILLDFELSKHGEK